MTTIYVVTGGESIPRSGLEHLPPPDRIIAADSGLTHALELGLAVDTVVGDMDSVPAHLLEGHPDVQRHPSEKDETDLELALGLALGFDPTRIVVLGGHGGRIDHLIANVGILAAIEGPEVHWLAGSELIRIIRDRIDLDLPTGTRISLLPHGRATVTTTGLRWNLAETTLDAGSGRGVSNRVETGPCLISVSSGILLVVIGL